jgi:uncharacterized protein YbaP (TraB family)
VGERVMSELNEEKIVKFLRKNTDIWKKIVHMYEVEYTAFLKKVEEEMKKKLGEKNFEDWYRTKLMAEWWREYDFIRENKPNE